MEQSLWKSVLAITDFEDVSDGPENNEISVWQRYLDLQSLHFSVYSCLLPPFADLFRICCQGYRSERSLAGKLVDPVQTVALSPLG